MDDRRDELAEEISFPDRLALAGGIGQAGAAPLPDEAVFAPVRLIRPRRPARAGVAIALAVGGLAALGWPDGAPHTTSADRVDRAAFAVADADAEREAPWRTHPGTGEPFAEPLLAFRAEVSGRRLFVNGDVFTRQADVVLVIVGERQGGKLELRPIELPGGSTAFRLGANDRFSVTFELDDWTSEVLWIIATAYDDGGHPLGSVRQSLGTAFGHERIPGANG